MDKKLTPDPPITLPTSRAGKLEKQLLDAAAERAFAHYGLSQGREPLKPRAPIMPTRPAASLSQEDKLATALSILQSAAATAYESADQLEGSKRKLAMGAVHLIELAQSWVDSAFDEVPAAGVAS